MSKQEQRARNRFEKRARMVDVRLEVAVRCFAHPNEKKRN